MHSKHSKANPSPGPGPAPGHVRVRGDGEGGGVLGHQGRHPLSERVECLWSVQVSDLLVSPLQWSTLQVPARQDDHDQAVPQGALRHPTTEKSTEAPLQLNGQEKQNTFSLEEQR